MHLCVRLVGVREDQLVEGVNGGDGGTLEEGRMALRSLRHLLYFS